MGCGYVNWLQVRKFLGHWHQILNTFYPLPKWKWLMPKAKTDIQDMSINDLQQNISVKITFYFNILKQSILDFFLRITHLISLVWHATLTAESWQLSEWKFYKICLLATHCSHCSGAGDEVPTGYNLWKQHCHLYPKTSWNWFLVVAKSLAGNLWCYWASLVCPSVSKTYRSTLHLNVPVSVMMKECDKFDLQESSFEDPDFNDALFA